MFIPVTKNQKNVKPYNKKNKQSHKIKATSLKEDKINTSVSKLLTTVTGKHKESKKTVHHKLKEYTMQHDCIQKVFENYSMFSLSKSLTQSPLLLTNSLVDTHKSESNSVFCH